MTLNIWFLPNISPTLYVAKFSRARAAWNKAIDVVLVLKLVAIHVRHSLTA